MTTNNDIITDGTNSLRSLACRLGSLAGAFDRTGNHTVAEELYEIAGSVHDLSQAMHDAYYEKTMARLDQDIKNSNRFVGSILKSLIEGKDPKDACIEAIPHHFDRDLIKD